MKILGAVLGLFFSLNAFALQTPPEVKKACAAAFEKSILQIYETTNAESVRMSRRLEFVPAEAKDPRLFLVEITANFFVKWPENNKEVPRLAGVRLVYDSTSGECESIDIVSYAKLRKYVLGQEPKEP